MRRKLIFVLFITGVILIPLAGLSFSMPYLFNSSKGTIEVDWGNPTGLKFNGLSKGDNLKISYTSEIEVNLYLLTEDQANEFRAPIFYKEPLPDPLIKGTNGSIEIDIAEDGDYELLFLPDEVFDTFKVDYELERYLKKEISIYILSGIGLILTSLVLVILGSVLLKRSNIEVMHK